MAKPAKKPTRAKAALQRQSSKKQPPAVVSPAEQAALDQWQQRRQTAVPLPLLVVEKRGDMNHVSVDHADTATGWSLLANAMGSSSELFVTELLNQTISLTGQGKDASADRANYMLAAMRGIAPQDEAESMLAAQMVATHMLAMNFAAKLANPGTATMEQADAWAGRITKLTRTYALQLDALKRYRTGGEQRVTVQHVNVNEGGQAIVGTVERR